MDSILKKFESKISIYVTGKNIERFIKRLYKNNINIYDVKRINRNKMYLKINNNDYDKIIKIKTIYEITECESYGLIKIKKEILKNKFIIIFTIISLIIIILLSNITFSIEIVHSSNSIRNIIYSELEKNGIKKYKFKKNYDELQKIKNIILNNNKDKLEWIEIENSGTKIIVKCEERILNKKEKDYAYQNIVATKSGIIKKIVADKGNIIVEKNDYVNKGDVLISGEVYSPNGSFLSLMSASGKVYAEVWYKLKINYPLIYSEKIYTNNKDTKYEILFFNKRIGINNNVFKKSEINDKIIIENNLLPIKLVKSEKREYEVKESINTYESALKEAENKARITMEERLNKDEEILYQKTLSFKKNDNTITAEIFFSVMENISKEKKLNESDYKNLNEETKE